MVRPMPVLHFGHAQSYLCSTPLAIGLFISVSFLLSLCAQHSRKVISSRKYSTDDQSSSPGCRKTSSPTSVSFKENIIDHPLISPAKRSSKQEESEEEESGGAGLWQKAILMGEKCQPPEFSGVLFYDSYGKRISELPRSPRAIPTSTPTTPLRNFSSSAQNTNTK